MGLLSHNPPETIALLARDGSQQIFELPQRYRFITGTPEGWLAFNAYDPNVVSHFTLVDGELEETILLELPHTEQWSLLEKPVLGKSLEGIIPFPEAQPQLGLG
jgi:hypothetical protein